MFAEWFPQATIVTSALECVARLPEAWDTVYLDYNLSGQWVEELGCEDNGIAVVTRIAQNRPEHLLNAKLIIHTSDSRRGAIMASVLSKAGYNAEHIPYWRLLREIESGAEQ